MDAPHFSSIQPPITHLPNSSGGDSTDTKELKTQQTFDQCKKMTLDSAKFVVLPKYSLFINSIKMLSSPADSFGGRIDHGMGVLMLMASPVYELLRIGIGVPVLIGGSIATGFTGVVHGIGLSIQKIDRCSKNLLISSTDQQRETMTGLFVKRMHATIQDMAYNEAYFFKNHPEQLINIAVISIAFLSRDLKGKTLKIDGQVLKNEDIAHQDEIRKSYFKDIYEIKTAIQSLQLSLDDAHAWDFLKKAFEELKVDEDKQVSTLDQNQKETIELILQHAFTLSQKVIEDEVFLRIWKKSLA